MLSFALFLLVSPRSAFACAEQDTPDVEGTLVIEQADYFDRAPDVSYSVLVADKDGAVEKIAIEPPADPTLLPDNLSTGMTVRLHGDLSEPGAHGHGVAAASVGHQPRTLSLNPHPSSSSNGKAVEVIAANGPTPSEVIAAGDQVVFSPSQRNLLVVVINFSDSTNGCSDTQLDGLLFTNAQSVASLYSRTSYGNVAVVRDTNGNGQPDIYRVTLPYAVGGSCNYSTWMNDANNLVVSQFGVNLSSYNRRLYYLGGGAGPCGWAGLGTIGPSWAIVNGQYCTTGNGDVAAHELGHNEGVYHSGTDTNNDGVIENEYGDTSDFMGYGGVGLRQNNAPHKIRLGWMPAGNILVPGSSQTVTLTGLDLNTVATQVIKVQRSAGGYYFFSFRVDDGVLTGLPSQYKFVTNIHWHSGSSHTMFIGTLSDGQSFTDSASGLTVTQNSHTTTSANVTVLIGSDIQPPTAAVQSAPNITSGGATSYSFTVRYQDNVAVKVSTLNTGDVVVSKAGFSQTANFVSVDVGSDGTPRTATYSITPPGGSWDAADNATYTVTLQGSQVTDTNNNAAASGTLGTFSVNIGGTDSDGDGVPDASDNCPTVSNANQANFDGDSQGDACDTDDDNDGVTDSSDCSPLNAALYRNQAYQDPDTDGIRTNASLVTVACFGSSPPSGYTLNVNGPDNCPTNSNANQANFDGDSQGDACDTDDDNDGVADSSDCAPLNAAQFRNQAYADPDGDGVRNTTTLATVSCFGTTAPSGYTVNLNGPDNCPSVSNANQADDDHDGIGNACEVTNQDSDGDGVPDTTDCAPTDPTVYFSQAYPDADSDGVRESATLVATGVCFGATVPAQFTLALNGPDNCPTKANPTQEDSDGDGLGNACDRSRGRKKAALDFDGDGLSDTVVRAASSGSALGATYYIHRSSDGAIMQLPFGSLLNLAAPADYTGDGIADVAEVQSQNGQLSWVIRLENNTDRTIQFGFSTDGVLSGCDFSGDGIDDLAVLRAGVLLYRNSDTGELVQPGYAAGPTTQMSSLTCGDVNGDGRDDLLALWSPPGKRSAAYTFTPKKAKLQSYDQSGALLLSYSAAGAVGTFGIDANRDGLMNPGALFDKRGKRSVKIFTPGSRKVTLISLKGMQGSLSPLTLVASSTGRPEHLVYLSGSGQLVAQSALAPKSIVSMGAPPATGQIIPAVEFVPGL